MSYLPLEDTSLHQQPHRTEWPKSVMFVLLSPHTTSAFCGCFLHTQFSKREIYLQLVGNVQKNWLTFWRSTPATGNFDIFIYLVPETVIFIITENNFSGRITYLKTAWPMVNCHRYFVLFLHNPLQTIRPKACRFQRFKYLSDFQGPYFKTKPTVRNTVGFVFRCSNTDPETHLVPHSLVIFL